MLFLLFVQVPAKEKAVAHASGLIGVMMGFSACDGPSAQFHYRDSMSTIQVGFRCKMNLVHMVIYDEMIFSTDDLTLMKSGRR